jgi:hypothetical protein
MAVIEVQRSRDIVQLIFNHRELLFELYYL